MVNFSRNALKLRLWLNCQFGYDYCLLVKQVLVIFCPALSTLFFLNKFILGVVSQIFYPNAQMVICICKDSSSSQTNNRGTLVRATNLGALQQLPGQHIAEFQKCCQNMSDPLEHRQKMFDPPPRCC